MNPWQAFLIGLALLLNPILDKISGIADWYREKLDWSKRKAINLSILTAVILGLAIYFWPAMVSAQPPAQGEFEILGARCTPSGGVQIVIDVSKAGVIGVELPPGLCQPRGMRIRSSVSG